MKLQIGRIYARGAENSATYVVFKLYLASMASRVDEVLTSYRHTSIRDADPGLIAGAEPLKLRRDFVYVGQADLLDNSILLVSDALLELD